MSPADLRGTHVLDATCIIGFNPLWPQEVDSMLIINRKLEEGAQVSQGTMWVQGQVLLKLVLKELAFPVGQKSHTMRKCPSTPSVQHDLHSLLSLQLCLLPESGKMPFHYYCSICSPPT